MTILRADKRILAINFYIVERSMWERFAARFKEDGNNEMYWDAVRRRAESDKKLTDAL